MPKQLNNPKISQALVEAFGLKGRYAPMLDEVLVPVYIIEDPAPAEPNKIATGFSRVDGEVNPSHQLFNPAGSGVMLVVNAASLTIITSSGGAAQAFVNLQLNGTGVRFPDDATANASQWRDLRINKIISTRNPSAEVLATHTILPGGVLVNQTIIEIGGGAGANDLDVLGTFPSSPRQPAFVIPPGEGASIAIVSGAATVDVSIMNVRWEEIPLTLSATAGTPP